MYNPLKLVGKTVVLEEIQPKYFADVIRWRNDKELNRFLNQPFELTMELQEKWFEQYVKDDTQGLLIMIDKKTQEPFGTIGWTDLDLEEKVCIFGRLLVGNESFNGSWQFAEGYILQSNYLYNEIAVDAMYGHIVAGNIKSVRINEQMGFYENKLQCKVPEELMLLGVPIIEIVRKKEDFEKNKLKNQILELINRNDV